MSTPESKHEKEKSDFMAMLATGQSFLLNQQIKSYDFVTYPSVLFELCGWMMCV